MLYLANPCANDDVLSAMREGYLGYIDTPRRREGRPDWVVWAADNGCFGKDYQGDDHWYAWLVANTYAVDTCLFANAPDVVGDAVATLASSAPWLPRIRELGYPAALVAQDGLEHLNVPWDTFDCLFIGGTTDWKLSGAVRELIAGAKERGKWVHMGRVNSERRFLYALALDCDSVDGTYLTFGPNTNLPKLLRWTRWNEQTVMW